MASSGIKAALLLLLLLLCIAPLACSGSWTEAWFCSEQEIECFDEHCTGLTRSNSKCGLCSTSPVCSAAIVTCQSKCEHFDVGICLCICVPGGISGLPGCVTKCKEEDQSLCGNSCLRGILLGCELH